jgi:5'-3' exonuclease
MYFAHFNPSVFKRYIDNGERTTIFIDFNSNMTSFFDEKSILNILNMYKVHNKYVVVKPILLQLITFLSEVKDSRIIIHLESGRSQYHVKVNKNYKEKRGQYVLLKEEEVKAFFDIYDSVKDMFEKVINLIPLIYVVHFKYMEADIVPYTYMKMSSDVDESYILCSSDKDLYQVLSNQKVKFQYRQLPTIKPESRLVNSNNCLLYITKKDCEVNEKLKPRMIPFLLSIAGDSSDSVTGIGRVGYITVQKELEKVAKQKPELLETEYTTINELEELYEKMLSLMSVTFSKKIDENFETIINNHKLTDFNIIHTYMDHSFKELVKKKCLTKKSQYLTVNDFVYFLKEVIWDDPEWLLTMKNIYEELLISVERRSVDG